MSCRLRKFPEEVRLYAVDFSAQTEIVAGDTIASAIVAYTVLTGTGTITFGAVSISANKAQFQVSGGTAAGDYRIKCTATTTNGKTLVGIGVLEVRDPDCELEEAD